MNEVSPELSARAHKLHDEAIVIDTHIDTTQRLMDAAWCFTDRQEIGHVDLPRLREGGVSAVFMAVWTPQKDESPAYATTVRTQIQRIQQLCSTLPEELILAHTSDDVRVAKRGGKVAILIGLEGGYLIEDSIELLHEFRAAGATYMTLTHAKHTNWADSAGVHHPLDPRHHGLTDFGRDIIREMNRIGMMVDVSHVSDQTFWDVAESTSAPIIASHSSCRAISPHRRNMTDDMMRAIASTGGVIQINFASLFVDPNHPPVDVEALNRRLSGRAELTESISDYRAPLSCLVDHFVHAVQVVGPAHVGIGSDFDGVPAVPADMEDCSKLPNLTAALLQRGFNERDLGLILGENMLRVMDAFESIAAKRGRTAPQQNSIIHHATS